MKASGDVYFQRCAGCHGVLRKGATGKNLEPQNTTKLGQERREKIIAMGTDGGMVNFDDIPTKEEIKNVATWSPPESPEQTTSSVGITRKFQKNACFKDFPEVSTYIQQPPQAPPEWGMKDMLASWKNIVPVEKRPTKQMNKLNLNNVFSVTLRDAGEVALIDGDKKAIISRVKTGYAVHISRISASGRCIYVIGRGGQLSLIDMWMENPGIVAEMKMGLDARSIDTSKFKGFEDKFAIAGSYWPPQYVIMEGDTLKPIKIMSTRGITVYGEYHPEPRVACIVASMTKPEWVVNIKETGLECTPFDRTSRLV